MAIIFKLKDIVHCITAKFSPAYLPGVKKKYYLHTKYVDELDIHGIASKAKVYGIPIDPLLIEEVLSHGLELIAYLAANGYKIKTPLFTLKVTIPGEYDGTETQLPDGILPQARIKATPKLKQYIREHVELNFEGIEHYEGLISNFYDKFTDTTNTCITPGRLYIIRGIGLKIAFDTDHTDDAGLYYEEAETGIRIRQEVRDIMKSEPTIISALAPSILTPGKSYYIAIRTQSPIRNGGTLLKDIREIKSNFTITVPAAVK
jgi:hypothetical protein